MEPFLYYPVKDPINQSNLFGVTNAMYTALGQLGHPGNDFESPTGTKIFAPCDGQARYVTDSLHGDGIWIHTIQNGQNYNVILWHMPSPSQNPPQGVASAAQYPFQLPTDGSLTTVKAGDFLGYTDDSGYPKETTGPHLHFGVMPSDQYWSALNANNGYLGCVDPTPYFNQKYAEDINTPPPAPTPQAIEEASEVVKTIASSSLPSATKETFLAELLSLLQKYL